jgi:hypothetical protein
LCNLTESTMTSLLNLLLASFLAMGAATPAPASRRRNSSSASS